MFANVDKGDKLPGTERKEYVSKEFFNASKKCDNQLNMLYAIFYKAEEIPKEIYLESLRNTEGRIPVSFLKARRKV